MLHIAGCNTLELAAEFGTPVFVYDEQHLRDRCREAVEAFGPGVAYATKAFLCGAMAPLAHEEGMHLDVATGGELHVALSAGVPADRLVLHGNNKSPLELRLAVEAGVHRIVVDSFDELDRLDALHAETGVGAEGAAAADPRHQGRDPRLHLDRPGRLQVRLHRRRPALAQQAIDRARNGCDSVELVGIHAHIGSQVFAVGSLGKAAGVMGEIATSHDFEELSVGGGLGVPYVEDERAPTIAEWGRVVRDACAEAGVTARITAEPGRSITAAAAVTLYTVGTIKEIPGVRTYVSVDGGMSDNPRPVLYGSGYETFLPRCGRRRPAQDGHRRREAL